MINQAHMEVIERVSSGVVLTSDLGSPKGIRFSGVTDTSATIHWLTSRARVDNYQVTYVPAHGGRYHCYIRNSFTLSCYQCLF
ncbi:hypothetical protein ILYODFUR_037968 [Ilyodon furcidens]|uniref:Fibronectin type-III domain-containing protein n=1 Tax=Ilyodon furcidens TaxID=33524 RepID=A0ABV0UYM8_9TELE